MNPEPSSLPPQRKIWPTLLLGMVVANLVGGILFLGLLKFISAYKESQLSVLATPNLFLVPFFGHGICRTLCTCA